MAWTVEFTNELEDWWLTLDQALQEEIDKGVHLLQERGPHLQRPWSGSIDGSRVSHLRELIIQYKGDPYRILYAFDPRRVAVLLCGDIKLDDKKFYRKMIPIAERLYQILLQELLEEGLIDAKDAKL